MICCVMLREAKMGIRALPLTPPNGKFPSKFGVAQDCYLSRSNHNNRFNSMAFQFAVSAKSEKGEKDEPNKSNQSLLSNITEALDFSQVRSSEDAELLAEAREATKSGGKMSREQYGALRRKIGGTYKDFFKSYIEVDGQYVEDGWVDKTCKICKKDTRGESRQVDKLGRYVHVACLESSKSSGNFFTRLFSR
ncbi:uncharacterized protein LOC122292755 [Carya illinoinensis]|uniref:GATA-type transcription activator N-terminal domain-containing protein n=2 Tax=Carya illinoinensis TaxID=32201 RepID=A0A922GDL3_CARIL|nr:uncharacterized protein LOC122292755 [Carya illinoinensis]KAG6735168.1 hypothetical protein I3842_01G308300 [Carya illinoinensis]